MIKLPVFLFDIDSVLVAPYGYRAAVQATLKYFFHRMGLPDTLLPGESVMEGFEAIRITSEWDMVPICLAAAIDSWLAANPRIDLPGKLPEAILHIRQLEPTTSSPDRIDYSGLQERLKGRLPVGIYPAETVLKLAFLGDGEPPFAVLKNHGLLEDILAHSRDLDRSLTTRLFQHFTLGSAAFEESYRRPAEIQTPSLLASLDQPQLSPPLSQQIIKLRNALRLYPAAFTMRPSLAPRGVDGHLPHKYVPEAEIALELVGLSEIPLIGYGRMVYLADRIGLEPETLLKPSPVQAIAAILAAVQGDELKALQAAYYVYAKSKNPFDDILHPHGRRDTQLQVSVFEDSAGGIEAAHQAAGLLQRAGVSISVTGYGIAAHPEKISALESVEASIYPTTDQAIQNALYTSDLATTN